jgi:hypothetical protein
MQLQQLPDSSRVWIFGSDQELSDAQAREIRENLSQFLATWAAHNVPLAATADVLRKRFIVVALDESSSASGCSIDKLFKQISALEQRYGLRLLDSSIVFYGEANDDVSATDRAGFRRLAADGVVSEETAVFDPTLGTLGEFRRNFPARAGESWHRQLLS